MWRFAILFAAEESEWAIGPSTGGKPNPSTLNQILREDESRSTEGQSVELAFSRTNGNTRLSPNLLVQQVTTQKLL